MLSVFLSHGEEIIWKLIKTHWKFFMSQIQLSLRFLRIQSPRVPCVWVLVWGGASCSALRGGLPSRGRVPRCVVTETSELGAQPRAAGEQSFRSGRLHKHTRRVSWGGIHGPLRVSAFLPRETPSQEMMPRARGDTGLCNLRISGEGAQREGWAEPAVTCGGRGWEGRRRLWVPKENKHWKNGLSRKNLKGDF